MSAFGRILTLFGARKEVSLFVSAGVVLTALFLAKLVQAWKIQTAERVTCQLEHRPLLPGNNGYIELQINGQNPIEPYFNGGIFVNLTDRYGTEPKRLNMGRSLRVRHESGLIAVSVLHSALVHFEIYSAALTRRFAGTQY
jgi:hypothetical protein